MSKYSPLSDFLRAQARDQVPMTFAQIERLVGGKLPASHRYRSWWSNNSFNSVMTRAWLAAGFAAEKVDMKARKLVFRRVARAQNQPATSHTTKMAAGRPAISKRSVLQRATNGRRHRSHQLRLSDHRPRARPARHGHDRRRSGRGLGTGLQCLRSKHDPRRLK